MKNKKIYKWIILFIVIISLLMGGMAVKKATSTNIKENNIVIKENVRIIEDILPEEVTENEVVYFTNPKLEVGDVLVSGIVDAAPSGLLRTVTNIDVENGVYYITTEDSNLLDVFEELHITKSFELTEDGADEILLNVEHNQEDLFSYSYIQNYTKVDNVNYQKLNTNIKNQDYQFENSYNYDLENGVNVEGDFGFNVCLELTIDISGGDIIFGVAAGTEINGKLVTDMQGEVEAAFEKELKSYDLPNLQFQAGPVPIVVTNQMNTNIEGESSVLGDLNTSFEVEGQCIVGFEYDSKDGGINELNEIKFSTEGIECTTEQGLAGDVSVGLYVHLVSKLYGSTGFDISVGVAGATAGAIESVEGGDEYNGYIDLAILPKLYGNVVVSVPVIDLTLLSTPIFKFELEPLWEKRWGYGDSVTNQIVNKLPEIVSTDINKSPILYDFINTSMGIYSDVEVEDYGYYYAICYKDNNYSDLYLSRYLYGSSEITPTIGSKIVSIAINEKDYSKFENAISRMDDNRVIQEGDYTFAFVSFWNGGVHGKHNEAGFEWDGIELEELIHLGWTESELQEKINVEGYPTSWIRIDRYANAINSWWDVDVMDDFWDRYNYLQRKSYKAPDGEMFDFIISGVDEFKRFNYTIQDIYTEEDIEFFVEKKGWEEVEVD